jgi:hypothetical protein
MLVEALEINIRKKRVPIAGKWIIEKAQTIRSKLFLK